MPDIDWNSIFDESRTRPGATDDEIDEFVASALAPLSKQEIDTILESESNPYSEDYSLYDVRTTCNPVEWTLPDRPFPKSYLSLLRWSNGAECRTGDNWFMFFPAKDPCHGVRAMMLGYHVPEYLPGFVPFAFDGCGTFYLFDMRQSGVEGEYPIVCSHSVSLELEESSRIAETFVAACRGQWKWEETR